MGVLLIGLSCKSKEDPAVVSGDRNRVEIEFIKNGELEFLNEEGAPLQKIDIEIADTRAKRSRGLMERSGMDEKQGMLFIFEDDQVKQQTFYMKDTRFPLDIIYFGKDSVLMNIARNAQPGANSALAPGGTVEASEGDAKFVVEINGGLADVWGLKEGETRIRWTRN